MNGSSIAVPQILPRASTEWQGGHHAPDRDNNGEHRKDPPPAEPSRAPPAPPPGLGSIVDKSV